MACDDNVPRTDAAVRTKEDSSLRAMLAALGNR
ncbi:hypothetical protein SAMN04488595_11736 [Ralstonia sp. 25mfcol4.1]|jgi:hypothetical protein|nr:hypothetical protein SAMN04488595_11736 [Ralstonia sp. 25mfcol4.1]